MIFLESERLLFRPHIPADMDAYCTMEMDADVRRYIGGYPRTRDAAQMRFEGTLKPITSRLHIWATVYKPENVYIGRCGIYPHFDQNGEPIPGEASLGLYIAKGYWNMGFATEAGKAFIELGFNEFKLKKIVTLVQVENDASVRVLEKLGFKIAATEKGEYRTYYHSELEN